MFHNPFCFDKKCYLIGGCRHFFIILIIKQSNSKFKIPDKIEASRLLASLVSILNHYDDDHKLEVLDPDSSQVQLKACDTDHLKVFKMLLLKYSIAFSFFQKINKICL